MTNTSTSRQRRSLRLPDYDYTQPGAYFVTVCTQQRVCLLGEVVDGHVVLSEFGFVVREEWQNTPSLRPEVSLDDFVIMPNHLHGIVIIKSNPPVGAHGDAPLREEGG